MEAAKLFSMGSYKMEKFRFSLKGNLAKEIAFYHVVFICNKKKTIQCCSQRILKCFICDILVVNSVIS
jgi:hypothetical protein